MAKDLQIPKERFTCQSCGRCCRMWTITVDEARVEQLRREDWGGEPFKKRLATEGDSHAVRMVHGRCFFLDEENRCRIHGRLGYEAKPEGCKAFPLLVARVAGTTHLRLSFYCPTVSEGRGKPLPEQKRWIQSTVKAAGDVERSVPLTLDGELQISSRELEQIEDALCELLERDEPVSDRLAACGALLQRLCARGQAQGKAGLAPALREVGQIDLATLAAEGRAAGSASAAGPVLSLFLGHDCGPGSLARMGRFFGVRLFNLKLGRLRSRLMGARASWRAIQRVPFEPSPTSRGLLTRYLLHKLRARRAVTGEHSLLSGFHLLAAAYAVISLLSRMRAADQEREAVTDEDVEMAVQAADLLVVEHSALYQGGMLAQLTEAVLGQAHLCGALLNRVEPTQAVRANK